MLSDSLMSMLPDPSIYIFVVRQGLVQFFIAEWLFCMSQYKSYLVITHLASFWSTVHGQRVLSQRGCLVLGSQTII